MTTKPFSPKGEQEIRNEVVEDLGGQEFDNEDNADLIDRIVARRKKDEEFKVSEREKRKKLEKEIMSSYVFNCRQRNCFIVYPGITNYAT